MKILLVEDDDNKRTQLAHFVSETWPGTQVDVARSLQSGLRAIRKMPNPDLVLLDMTLPTYDIGPDEAGGSTHAFGGREFFKELRRFKRELPVIVVTQFEAFGAGAEMTTLNALDAELRSEFSANYVGYVYYRSAIESWKPQLKKMIESTASRTQ
jgi:DNA-binding response OmpR family regulator